MTGLEAALAGAAVKETVGPAKSLIAKIGKPTYERLIVEYCQCFQQHLNTSYDRCRYVKNILYRDNSVELISQYVNVVFGQGATLIKDQNVSDNIKSGGRLLISGTAGAGKTMFMKWLTLNLIDNIQFHQRIPLFLELRYLTKEALDKGLISWILSSTSPSEKRVTIDRFRIGLELGQFAIVLDAVDEVKPDLRENVINQIRILLRDFPDCPLLLSSRPDEELASIQELTVYHTVDMNESQIVEVIERLDFDLEVKNRLIKELKGGLFSKHREFLSNPLLATIMLLNFDHSADIPNKLTSFYRQAFEALYQRHDAAKGAYRRGHYAGLPLDEYEKVFSAFCFDSFVDSKVQFSDSELLDYFRAAASYCNIELSPELLVQDAMKSVCVIQREGLDNVFAHRSFQEYFTALFLSRYREDDFVEQIKDTTSTWQNNNVLKMLVEIAPEPVEQEWLQPALKTLVERIRAADVKTLAGCKTIFRALYRSFTLQVDNGSIVGFGHNSGEISGRLTLIGQAFNPPVLLSRKIFSTGAIFSSLESYLLQYKIENASAIIKRVELTDPDEDFEHVIEIEEGDLGWLMNSDLPYALGAVRDNITEFYDKMCERIANRSSAIARLKARHKPNPVRRRGKL